MAKSLLFCFEAKSSPLCLLAKSPSLCLRTEGILLEGKGLFLFAEAADVIHIYVIEFGKTDHIFQRNPDIAQFIICIGPLADMENPGDI